LAPLVVALFWRAMEEEDERVSGFFAVAALLGFTLILWSGSRGPSGATLLGVGILWWYFRSRLLLVMLLLAVLAVVGQLVLSGFTGDIAQLLNRVESVNSAEQGRTDVWLYYLDIAAKSPIYGTAPSGLGYATVGNSSLGEYLINQGVKVGNIGVHNSFLGIALKFGVIGLVLFLAMLFSAMIRARQVLFSNKIPDVEKRIYILPAAMLPVISFTMFFEDVVPGSGKGTVMSILLYASIFICHVYGAKLVNLYELKDSKFKLIQTVEGLKLGSQPSVST
jgi:O-antigen ligase